MDAGRNQFVEISSSEQEKRIKDIYDRKLSRSSRLNDVDKERLAEAGPPKFKKGEIVEIHGYQFKITRIDARKLILRPVKF